MHFVISCVIGAMLALGWPSKLQKKMLRGVIDLLSILCMSVFVGYACVWATPRVLAEVEAGFLCLQQATLSVIEVLQKRNASLPPREWIITGCTGVCLLALRSLRRAKADHDGKLFKKVRLYADLDVSCRQNAA